MKSLVIGGSNAVKKGTLGIKKILGESVKKTKDRLADGIFNFYAECDMEI